MLGLDPGTLVLALMSGAVIGLFLGAFGGGGSILATPLLLYVVGVGDTHLAVGTSAAAVAAIALFGLLNHARAGRVRWQVAVLFAVPGVLGALAGSSIAKAVGGDVLLLAFSVAMFAVAAAMFRRPKGGGASQPGLDRARVARVLPTGAAVGAASGFFGIGGGFLIVPGLMASARMPIGLAAAASLVSVAAFGAATSANYALSGLVDLRLTLALLLGGALGGVLGGGFASKLHGRETLSRRIFAGMILVVAAYVAIDAITGLV